MPRRGWGDLYAVGLVVFSLLGATVGGYLLWDASRLESQYQGQTDNKANEYRSRADHRAERRCRQVSAEAIRQCVYEEYNAAEQGEHDQTDLQAQLVTSAWTRAMGIAAIIGMSVGFAGVSLIFATFKETQKTASAAAAQVKVAQDIANRELRAYVGVEKIEIEQVYDALSASELRVTLKNYGQTPALVDLQADANYSDSFPRPSALEPLGSVPQSLQPGAKRTEHFPCPVREGTHRRFRAIVSFEYIDIYGARFVHRLRYVSGGALGRRMECIHEEREVHPPAKPETTES